MSCVIFNSAAPADATLLMAATKRQRHVQLFIRAERQKSRELEARRSQHPGHAPDSDLDQFWIRDRGGVGVEEISAHETHENTLKGEAQAFLFRMFSVFRGQIVFLRSWTPGIEKFSLGFRCFRLGEFLKARIVPERIEHRIEPEQRRSERHVFVQCARARYREHLL